MMSVVRCLLAFFVSELAGAFLLPGPSRDSCPDSIARNKYLHPFGDKCYQFVLYQSLYWADARHDCVSRGGDLVVIDRAGIQDFVMATLVDLGNTHSGIWIGLSDRKRELHWEWVNGEPIGPYSHWAHGQGGANFLHLTQDCAQIRLNDHGLWHDRECHLWPNTAPYICQFDLKPPTRSPSTVTSTRPSASTSSSTSTITSTTSTLTITSGSASPLTVSSGTSFPPTTLSTEAPVSTSGSTKPPMPIVTNSPMTSDKSPVLSNSPPLTTTTSISTRSQSPTNTVELSSMKTRTIATTTGDLSSHSLASTSSRMSLTAIFSSTFYPAFSTQTPVKNASASKSSSSASSLTSSVSTTSKSTKPSLPPTEVVCSDVECSRTCPNGYSGVYVGLDGCVTCMCN